MKGPIIIMKKEISLSDLLKITRKKIWIVIVLTLVCAIIAYTAAAFFTTPKYTSKTSLYLRNEKDGTLTTNDINLSQSLLNAYVKVLMSNKVITYVAQDLNAHKELNGYEFLRQDGYSFSHIKSSIKASTDEDSQTIEISITTTDPKEAQFINELLLKHFVPEVKRIIDTGEARVINEPTLPLSPSSPNITRNTMVGALIGFVLAMAIILLIYMMDTSVHNENDLLEIFDDITVLGSIPLIQSKDAQVYANINHKKAKSVR